MPKLPYAPPALVVFGDVQVLTQSLFTRSKNDKGTPSTTMT